MNSDGYMKERTALLLVDPYNDFLSYGGKLWPRVEAVAGEVGLLDNLRAIVSLVRTIGIRIFFVPHRRWVAGDYDSWAHPSPDQLAEAGAILCPCDPDDSRTDCPAAR